MESYYHFTSYDKLRNINEYGLVPQIGARTSYIGDDRYGVFLSYGMYQAIIMYGAMYILYKTDFETFNPELIEIYNRNINFLLNIINHGSGNEFIENRKNKAEMELNMIKASFDNGFIGCLGGYGCYLSVHNLDNNLYKNYEDCCYESVIQPSNINVVTLVEKNTGYYTDSREAIISFFMSHFSLDDFKNLSGKYKEGVEKLYNSNIYNNIYNKENYYINEIPIEQYLYPKQKIKPIMFN